MRRLLGVLSVLLLMVGAPQALRAQQTGGAPPGQSGGFQLEQNYPNPFNPSTQSGRVAMVSDWAP